MSFLNPIFLLGLPLILLPVIIHLTNRRHHHSVPWAATMFLIEATRQAKGLAHLRQLLILILRICAIAALLLAAARPLASGWIGLAGRQAETVILLLDRSASMEQFDPQTGESERSTALSRLSGMIAATGRRSEVVLIDSATLTPTLLPTGLELNDLPETAPTATDADIPALLRAAVDYVDTHGTGRTDVWLASDLQEGDWKPDSGEWMALRTAFSERPLLRLFLLAFADPPQDNAAISLGTVRRVRSKEGPNLAVDLRIRRFGAKASSLESRESAQGTKLPIEISINGTRTVETLSVVGDELTLLGHPIPLSQGTERGWGRIDLPADENPADNTVFFVFDDPALRKTVFVGDDAETASAIRTVASVANEPEVRYQVVTFNAGETALIPWREAALIFWQAPLPESDSPDGQLLRQYVASGRSLVFLPPLGDGGAEWMGLKWGDWTGGEDPRSVEWWRTESGLLAQTRSGAPLPVGDLRVFRMRDFETPGMPLLKVAPNHVLIAQGIADVAQQDETHEDSDHQVGTASGLITIWGTLPRHDDSNLASEGIVFFAMTHRALEEGVAAVAPARMMEASRATASELIGAKPLHAPESSDSSAIAGLSMAGLSAGAWEHGSEKDGLQRIAVNRPASEDDSRILSDEKLTSLMAGMQFRRIDDSVGRDRSLSSEIWRAFLVVMALALAVEAVLSLPPAPKKDARNARESRLNPVSSGT